VFLDGRLVRSEIDAVHLVAGYVAMKPLDLAAHSLQNVDRLLAVGGKSHGFTPEFGSTGIPHALSSHSGM
jgi:hypothetical protein